MPLFEFRCPQCSRRFAQLIGVTADSSEPKCPKCGNRDVVRLISRFARLRGEDEILEDLEDSALAADLDDPGSVNRWMREMGRQIEDDDDADLGEFIDEAEREIVDGTDAAAE